MKPLDIKGAQRLAHAEDIGRCEENRETLWAVIDIRDRERAVGVAGMKRERAAMPLSSFSDAERAQVAVALAVHASRMEAVAVCMQPAGTKVRGWLH